MYLDYSLWDRLGTIGKPIFLYGTGNGGDKIISALEKYGVKLEGVFASDGFVRDRTFHTFHVRSSSDVTAEYGDDVAVLLAFGTTLPSVREFIEKLDSRHDFFIPDVPLYGGELFDFPYFLAHRDELDSARELLFDEKSRLLFDDAVNFRLSGKMEYLRRVDDTDSTLHELFSGVQVKTIIDGGAFKGDSTEIFARTLAPDVIYPIEADVKTFTKLCGYAESEYRCKVVPTQGALWNEDGTIDYSQSGSRGAGESGKNRRAKSALVKSVRLDTAFAGIPVDFIKLDIEGAESEALDGGEDLIRKNQPSMAVSLYHRTDDLFYLIKRIHGLLPRHRLYLRRPDCIPMWDLTLYAIR